ncbi:uncharacterized protein LODBEIA_P34940 [Lodderomyces beijingensis]|uniref:Peptide hydrolase n=1 Tax=Lodderomyces beijingensis TaxID=1775926 RepID=A0ABP0ZSS6_9ASCO
MKIFSLATSLAILSTVNAFPTLDLWSKFIAPSPNDDSIFINNLADPQNEPAPAPKPAEEMVYIEDFESFDNLDIIDETAYKKLPEIDTEQLQSLVTKDALRSRAETLFSLAEKSTGKYGHPTRVIGSPGHFATVHYILRELRKLGGYYNIKSQSFKALDGRVNSYSLLIDGVQPKTLDALQLTPPTPNKAPVHGNLVLVLNSGCSLHDYPSFAKDNIVLVKRGECAFGEKSRNAGKVGAKAAIIYDSNGPLQGTLGTPEGDEVPTLAVVEKEVAHYIEQLQKVPTHKFETTLYVDSYVRNISTLNVIAETAFGDHDNVVSLGAHSDSVGAGPGINDDGSGTISLLEVAKLLTKFKVNNAVRFGWWAAEEEGLLGSEYYANSLSKEENAKIRLFMDYDMMASPNYEYEVYDANNNDHPNGSGDLKDLYVDWYKQHGLNFTFVPFDGRSDYVGFINNKIPAGGIATGAEGVKNKSSKEKFGGEENKWFDPCYHQLCDDLSNPSYEAWEVNTKLIAHSVAVYAKSFAGFPEREGKNETEAKVQQSGLDDLFMRRGDRYIM